MKVLTDKNGIYYYPNTPDSLIRVLYGCLTERNSIRVYYGDVETGKCWNEEHDVRGRIGKSTGTKPILLLCHVRAYGGGALLTDCILKIVDIKTKRVLYQHEKFIQPIVTMQHSDHPEYAYNILIDGELYGRCKTYRQALLLKTKMT
jgi:hypothetical protein